MITQRIRRFVVSGLAFTLAGLLALSPTTFSPAVYAQTSTILGQGGVNVLTSNSQTLQTGLQHWYRFDYAGGNQRFSVSLDVNPPGGAGFQVWTDDQITLLANNPALAPLAVGNADVNNQSRIVWEASFAEPETYYIVVRANTDVQYVLNITALDAAPAPGDVTTLTAASTVDLNVRTGPATTYPVIRTVPIGTQMSVLGEDATGTWLYVQFGDGTQGWVAEYLTTFGGTAPILTTLPLIQPPLAPPPVVTQQTEPGTTFNVNVRTGPSTAYPVIRTVPAGTVVTILGQNAESDWLNVRLSDGTEGWMARWLTTFTGTAPIVAAPQLTQPPLAPPSTIPAESIPSAITFANVRTGPATTYPVIRTVSPGTQMSVLGQDSTTGWLLVQFSDGMQGWMARWLTTYTGAAPIVSAPILAQPPLAPPATLLPLQPGPQPAEQALGSTWRTLGSGEIHWYTFEHSGDETEYQIWLDSEPNDGVSFRLFKEQEAQAIMAGTHPDDITAFGAGTPNPNEAGDLFWEGDFVEHGRFYVLVTNSGPRDIQYSIFGSGPGGSGLSFVR